MKKKGIMKKYLALLLTGMLIMSSLPISVSASEDTLMTTETTSEKMDFDASEVEMTDDPAEYTLAETAASAEEATEYYIVTLDANGGYFVNEWDDVLNCSADSVKVLKKKIHVGEAISSLPVREQDGAEMVFLGWSLDLDGELLTQQNEKYVPVGNSVLYAVWENGENPEVLIDASGDYKTLTDPSIGMENSIEDDIAEDGNNESNLNEESDSTISDLETDSEVNTEINVDEAEEINNEDNTGNDDGLLSQDNDGVPEITEELEDQKYDSNSQTTSIDKNGTDSELEMPPTDIYEDTASNKNKYSAENEEIVENEDDLKNQESDEFEIVSTERKENTISEDNAFFLGKVFKAEGSINTITRFEINGELIESCTDIISFKEMNGEVIATWQNARGIFSWPLYVSWSQSGNSFSMIIPREGTSGYGMLSEIEIYGARFKGILRDDGRWDISIHNAQGNRCVGNIFQLCTVGSGDINHDEIKENTLWLPEIHSCKVGETVTVIGVLKSYVYDVHTSFSISDSANLSMSNIRTANPYETGNYGIWYIYVDITAGKTGSYELVITANDISSKTLILVESDAEPNIQDSLTLEPFYSCYEGDSITLTGMFFTNASHVSSSLKVPDNKALSFSDISTMSPSETGEKNTWYISVIVNTLLPGTYEIGLSVNGITKTTSICVKPDTEFDVCIFKRWDGDNNCLYLDDLIYDIYENFDVGLIQSVVNSQGKKVFVKFKDGKVSFISPLEEHVGIIKNYDFDENEFSNKYVTHLEINDHIYDTFSDSVVDCRNLELIVPGTHAVFYLYNSKIVEIEPLIYRKGRLDSRLIEDYTITIDGVKYLFSQAGELPYTSDLCDWEGKRIGYYIGTSQDIASGMNIVYEIVGLTTDEAFLQIYSSESDMEIKSGDTMEIVAALVVNGEISNCWSPSFVIGDNTVLSMSDYTLNELGYSIDITGLAAGISSLTISDSETGAHHTLNIKISSKVSFGKNYAYKIDAVPAFYPNSIDDSDKLTNFYDFYGIYINNYQIEEVDEGTKVHFDAYNSNFMTGAVDVYNGNGEWILSEPINKNTDIESIYDTGKTLVYLIWDGIHLNLLSYTANSFSTWTPIDVIVPHGGYLSISNNFAASPGACLYNCADFLSYTIEEVLKNKVGSDSTQKNIYPKLMKAFGMVSDESGEATKTLRKEFETQFINKIVDKAAGSISSGAGSLSSVSTSAIMGATTDDFKDFLDDVGVGWESLFGLADTIGEGIFEELSGPAGLVLDSMFLTNHYMSIAYQAHSVCNSLNRSYITIHSRISSQNSMTVSGVTVSYDKDVIDKDTVLQVFRVGAPENVWRINNQEVSPEQYILYNIWLVKNDEYVQPNGKCTVRIPAPFDAQQKKYYVYRQEPNGTWTKLNTKNEGKYLVFETDHFSLYLITKDIDEDEGSDEYFQNGCHITTTPIASAANTTGIEIELDKESYAVQEGDALTIDATIKTNKERIEGQHEYIGYFAYFANRQWNQLASWDIEGGSSKYTITQKIDNWSKYGDVMFTVSVFPKDSFVQGAALIDNVFLVNVSKKPQGTEETDDVIETGTCGDSLKWRLDKDGKLVISGTGSMYNWTYESKSPWDKYATDIKVVLIENGVTSIGNMAFYNCKKLKSVDFGDTVQEIGESSFVMTYDLSKVSIPDSVKVIKKSAFSCSWIEELSLGNGIQRIEDNAFGGNFALTTVVFPESITYLGKSVFDGIEFNDIYFCGEAPEMGYSVFVNEENATVYYPVWSETWDKETRDSQHWGNITWKTWNPGNKKSIVLLDVQINGSTFTYSGNSIKPSVSVKDGRTTLVKNTDYSVSYSNNNKVGNANVVVRGIGDYYGRVEKLFTITPASISKVTVTGIKNKTYTGKALTQNPTITLGSATLMSNTDYKLTYKNNTNSGTATVIITGSGNYKDSIKKTFTISRASIAKAKVTCPSTKVYTGWALTPVPTVKLGSQTLKKGTDFGLSFKNNKNVGTATITISGKGNYTGTLKKTFKILPKGTTILKLIPDSKKITVKWKKQTIQTKGYQIQYSSRGDFKTQKIVTVGDMKTVSKTISGFARKRKYYVRIRTYKTVGKVNYYSSWSVKKTVTTK